MERPGQGAEQGEDGALLERIADGDRRAFELLYHRYHRRLFSFLFRTVRRPELVEELVDDVMLAVWQGARGFGGRSQVSTWIFGIGYRVGLKAVERIGRQRPVEPVELAAAAEAADDRLERRELADGLSAALRELSAEHRAVIELAVGQGLGYREIAAIVDCPVNTVKTRMFHGRRRLREALERRGWLRP